MRAAIILTHCYLPFLADPFPRNRSGALQFSKKPDADRLGLTCAQILQMTSSEWIAKVTSIDASAADGNLRGIRVYGTCYDQRTDRLAASLAKTGKGPVMERARKFPRFRTVAPEFHQDSIS